MRSVWKIGFAQAQRVEVSCHVYDMSYTWRLFRKADKFVGPFTTWMVHNSLITHLPLTQVLWSTGSHSSSLWTAFLASINQARALECAFVVLNSMGMHCHAYRKYTRSLRNMETSYHLNTHQQSRGVHIRGVPLYQASFCILQKVDSGSLWEWGLVKDSRTSDSVIAEAFLDTHCQEC